MKIRKLGIAVALGALLPNPAHAQSDAASWKKVTTDQGCIAYMYDSEPLAGTKGYWLVYHWTGNCIAGQPIEGAGSMQEHSHVESWYDGVKELDYGELRILTGNMVGGYFQGLVSNLVFKVNDKGEWNSAGESNEVSPPYPYQRGCMVVAASPYIQEFCEKDRSRVGVAKIYKKPLWKDMSKAAAAPTGGLAAAPTESSGLKASFKPAPAAAPTPPAAAPTESSGVKASFKPTPVAAPAQPAGAPPKPADLIWTSLRSNGCTLIFNHGHDGYNENYSADFSGNKILSIAPSFACGADGLAQGPVKIVTTWQLLKGKDAGAIIVDTLTGSAKEGFLEGSGQNMVAGAVSYAGKPFGAEFSGGCIVGEANCDKMAGQQLRSKFVGGNGQAVVNASVAPPVAPVAFTQTENVAFSNVQNQLASDIAKSGSNGAALTETILKSLQLSFLGGSPAAFGDSATLDLALANVRTALAGNASRDTNQLLDLVMKTVRDTLASKKAVSQPQLAAIVAPIQAAPAPVAKPATPARAAPSVSYATLRNMPFDRRWSVRSAGRCSVIMLDRDLMWDDSGAGINGNFVRLEWSGACDASGLAQGQGTLASNALGEFRNGRTIWVGSMNQGMLNGLYKMEDQEQEGGRWAAWSDDGGVRRYDMSYANGCATGEYAEPCNQSDGLAMRDNFLAGTASMTANPTSVAPPGPPPASLAKSPKLISDLGTALTVGYPTIAIANKWEGTTRIAVRVDANGGVLQCDVSKTSGYPELDQAACNVVYKYARFSPATDYAGRSVEGSFFTALAWRLPE